MNQPALYLGGGWDWEVAANCSPSLTTSASRQSGVNATSDVAFEVAAAAAGELEELERRAAAEELVRSLTVEARHSLEGGDLSERHQTASPRPAAEGAGQSVLQVRLEEALAAYAELEAQLHHEREEFAAAFSEGEMRHTEQIDAMARRAEEVCTERDESIARQCEVERERESAERLAHATAAESARVQVGPHRAPIAPPRPSCYLACHPTAPVAHSVSAVWDSSQGPSLARLRCTLGLVHRWI